MLDEHLAIAPALETDERSVPSFREPESPLGSDAGAGPVDGDQGSRVHRSLDRSQRLRRRENRDILAVRGDRSLPRFSGRSAMTLLATRVFFFASVLAAAGARSASGQCLEWSTGFGVDGVRGPSNESVNAFAVFDDGSGPALYVGGEFTDAGGVVTSRLARWSGSAWSPVAAQPDSEIRAMAVFDDGSGPALYVAGGFSEIGGISASRIAKWNGSVWSGVGGGVASGDPNDSPEVLALTVFDDGTGAALYAGGTFGYAGGVRVDGIARWDGSTWSALAGGGVNGYVATLLPAQDPSGPILYVGGEFLGAGGVTATCIASWNGTSWSSMGIGLDGTVRTLALFDDGSGTTLYAGGSFQSWVPHQADWFARWNGVAWRSPGNEVNGAVGGLAAFDDGTGAKLYVVGSFTSAGASGTNNLARWDGSSWAAVGSGLTNYSYRADHPECWEVFDDGSGPGLYLGGHFIGAGGKAAYQIARWSGGAWSGLSDGSGQGTERVRAFTTFDDGGGTKLVAGGNFMFAGDSRGNNVARWDGSSWSPLGAGLLGTTQLDAVSALAVYDSGSGPELYAGGNFYDLGGGVYTGRVARWNGSGWVPLDHGVSGAVIDTEVQALCVYDAGGGPSLYASGMFTAASGVPSPYIARWDGTNWSAVGGGLNYSGSAMVVFDDGTGPALYVGGSFGMAGGQSARCIARWDGSTWSPLGLGMDGVQVLHVGTLAVFDDGSGPALYAGGAFESAGGVPATNIARWNGTSWAPVGDGLCSPDEGLEDVVSALAVFDDGSGPALYAGGSFTCSGTTALTGVAKWTGSSWLAVGGGVGGGRPDQVFALSGYTDPSGGSRLYAGGSFLRAGSTFSSGIAAWIGCANPPGTPYCEGDGTIRPCPCGNDGALGHGCENSASTGGATLTTNGSTHPDTVVLLTSGERVSALTVFMQGTASIAPVLYGDGLRCVSGQLKRLYSKNAVNGSTSAPRDDELSITQRSAALGDPIAPGSRRHYQAFYRDPDPSFCPSPTGSTFNVTNGVSIQW
jgi:hypothetical protein